MHQRLVGKPIWTHFKLQGKWNVSKQTHHINWLEMKAVQLALVQYLPQIRNKRILIRCDNSTVVSYINKEGGTRSFLLCLLTREIFQWAGCHNIVLSASHISERRNVHADRLFRGRLNIRLTEWSLNQNIVRNVFQVSQRFDPPNIDLFATWENKKLQKCSAPHLQCKDPLQEMH